MSDRPKGSEPRLFDLPLQPPPAGGEEEPREGPGEERPRPGRAPRRPRGAVGLPLFPDQDEGEPLADDEDEVAPAAPPGRASAAAAVEEPSPLAGADEAGPPPRPRAVPAPSTAPGRDDGPEPLRRRAPAPAGPGRRLRANLVDAGVHLLAALLGAGGALVLKVPLDPGDAVPFALFLLVFSFLYTAVTLAFWGQTPGMVVAGLVARSAGDQPLSFGQTGLRWLAGLLTVVGLGLPLALVLTRRSLADRLSGSATYERG
jgi:hypothetical protein